MFLTYFLIVCSLAMLVWTAGTIFWRYKYDSKLRLKKNFIAIVQLFSAVFFLIGAGVCMLNTSPEKLDGPDSFVKVLSYTFQLFTLDETFETSLGWIYLIKSDVFRGLYTALSVLYSVLVPFAGGFIIFNLLSSIVPRFRLLVNSFKRTKFVFSELNERSITLAEDIAKQSWLAHRHRLEDNKENEGWLKSCIIIFLNVNKDDVDREFFDRASRIGAICMNDDILERSFSFLSFFPTKIVYFMMDTNPWSNLNSAVALLSSKRDLWKRTVTRHEQGESFEKGSQMRKPKIYPFKTDNMNMYVFTENPEAGKLLEDAFGYNCERRKILYHDDENDVTKMDDVIAKCDSNITVFVVNEYKNLVYTLLMDNDGELLLGNLLAADGNCGEASGTKEAKEDGAKHDGEPASEVTATPDVSASGDADDKSEGKWIRIAILGGGKIAKEFLKTVVWCAQLLDPDDTAPTSDNKGYKRVRIEIDLISDNAHAFEQEMRYTCPAIFGKETWDDFGKCPDHKSDNFDYGLKTKFIDDMSFEEAAFGTDGFEALFNRHDLYDSDMFLIALGDDDLNLRAASWTRKKLMQMHGAKKTSLYFAIEDDALCATLKSRSNTFMGRDIVEMVPFGALKERFSYSNIVRPHLERLAREIDNIHSGRRMMKSYICNYNFESSTAAALHGPFRKYSIKNQSQLDGETVQRLYWLEHRRWSAYVASLGVVYPTATSFFENMKVKGFFSTNRLTDSGWHSCITDSYATYFDPADILKKIISAYGVEMKTSAKEDGSVQDDLDATLASGELLKIDCIRANEQDVRDGEFLGEYIDRWFNGVIKKVPSIDVSSLDPLDKLSIFMSIQNRDKVVDLKDYDIKIARNTFLCETQQALIAELGRPSVDENAVSLLVSKFLSDKLAVEKFSEFMQKTSASASESEHNSDPERIESVAEEENNDKVEKEPRAIDVKMTYIVSVDDGDYMLLEGDYIAEVIANKEDRPYGAHDGDGAGQMDVESSAGDEVDGRSKLKQHDVIIVGDDKLLVKVPLKGKVCIGYIQSAGDKFGVKKRRNVYMFQEARHYYELGDASDYTKSVSAFDNRQYYYICDSADGFSKEDSVDPKMDLKYAKPWNDEKIESEKNAILKKKTK